MSKAKNLNEEIKIERKKLKGQPLSVKLAYIWEYYKLPIFSVLLLILLVVWVIATYRDNNYETSLRIAIINDDMPSWNMTDDVELDYITAAFPSYLGIDQNTKRVIVEPSYILDEGVDADLTYEDAVTLVALMSSKSLDVVIGDEKAVSYFTSDSDQIYYDLNEFLPEDMRDALSDYFVYHTYSDGRSVAIALDLTESDLARHYGFSMLKAPMMSVIANCQNPDNAITFIRFAFGI